MGWGMDGSVPKAGLSITVRPNTFWLDLYFLLDSNIGMGLSEHGAQREKN